MKINPFVFLFLTFVLSILMAGAASPVAATSQNDTLQHDLDRGDVQGAQHYVAHPPTNRQLQPEDAYARIADRQSASGDFRGARKAIALIANPRAKRVEHSLVTQCEALIRLASRQRAAGRSREAIQTLDAAGTESLRINEIFVEMGDAPTIWSAQVWLDSAELRGKFGQRKAALHTLAKAENALTSSISLDTAGDLLSRVAADYRTFHDTGGKRRASREQRIIALQGGYG